MKTILAALLMAGALIADEPRFVEVPAKEEPKKTLDGTPYGQLYMLVIPKPAPKPIPVVIAQPAPPPPRQVYRPRPPLRLPSNEEILLRQQLEAIERQNLQLQSIEWAVRDAEWQRAAGKQRRSVLRHAR